MRKQKQNFRKSIALLVAAILAAGCMSGCGAGAADRGNTDSAVTQSGEQNAGAEADKNGVSELILTDDNISLNGVEVSTEQDSVYLSHDIIYYEDREQYDSGNPYGEGSEEERHTETEAAAHTVVNITEAGIYRISGVLSRGQIRVDLGEEAFDNPEAVVTLILDGVDITCEVAPAILFLSVYECDHDWSEDTAASDVDTSAAGANLVLAEGSVNEVNGSYVARIYKDAEGEKKLWKQDGAIYSYMSLNVDGEGDGSGVLNLRAENEGLDTELHLTVNGGHLNIYAGNDGINTNEDGVSVTTINGGKLHIIAGLGEEGDGVDSNGWLVINGGTVIAAANPAADAGLDSDMGSYINGGTVVALGSTMDWAESDSEQVTMNLQFAQYNASDSAIVVKDTEGNLQFAYDPSEDEVVGENVRSYMGAVVSSPEFALEESYHVFIGGTLKGTESAGVYEIASITEYSDGVQQSYTGTDVMMRPGMMGGMGGMRPGDGMHPDDGMRPDGTDEEWSQEDRGDRGPGGFGGKLPEGEAPQIPDGKVPQIPEEMPEGAFRWPGDREDMDREDVNSVFYMQDKVNCFYGVADRGQF